MSYAATAPPRRRPATVVIAVVIQFLIAALGLAAAVTMLAVQNTVVTNFRANAAGSTATQTQVNDVATVIRVSLIVGALVLILLAVVFAALGVGNLRGSNGTRIVTWVWCLIGLCGACLSTVYVGSASAADTINTDGATAQTAQELGQAFRDAYPGWFTSTVGTLSVLQALGYIAVAVLLALPTSNSFYRRVPSAVPPPQAPWPPNQPPPHQPPPPQQPPPPPPPR